MRKITLVLTAKISRRRRSPIIGLEYLTFRIDLANGGRPRWTMSKNPHGATIPICASAGATGRITRTGVRNCSTEIPFCIDVCAETERLFGGLLSFPESSPPPPQRKSSRNGCGKTGNMAVDTPQETISARRIVGIPTIPYRCPK
jgi:hypothetical protein